MFGAASSGSTGLFGASQSKPAFGSASAAPLSGFLFGSQAPSLGVNNGINNSTPSFGSAQGTGFGASTATATAPTGSSSFSFGSNNNASLAPSASFGSSKPTTGGLFGNAASSTAPSTGLFGGSSATNNSTPATSLFGANTTLPKPASTGFGQTTTSGGLFGSATQSVAPANKGLFGNASTTAAPAPSTGLFGKPATPAPTGGLFGAANVNATATNTVAPVAPVATATQTAQPSFSWGKAQAQPSAVTTNLSDSLQLNSSNALKAQQSTSNYTPAINDQIIKLKEQWDPNSPKCTFQMHLYNLFTEQEINILLQQPRPADESPDDWEKAMAQRPSPLHFPVKVSSFTEVAQRIEVQLDHVAKSRILLNNIYDKLNQLSSKHDLDNTKRILEAKVRHAKLSKRLLRLARVLAILKLKGYPLLPEEEEISRHFQALNAKITDPNGSVGKLSDLYARLAILKGRSEDLSSQLESSIRTMNRGLNNVPKTDSEISLETTSQTDHVVNQLTKLLYKQQVGLSYLNEVVQKDMDAVDKIGKR